MVDLGVAAELEAPKVNSRIFATVLAAWAPREGSERQGRLVRPAIRDGLDNLLCPIWKTHSSRHCLDSDRLLRRGIAT